MISFQQVSIFDTRCDVLVCPVNLAGVPGKGLALEFKKRFPKAIQRYEEACQKRELTFKKGLATKDNGQIVYFFASKGDWNLSSRIEWIESGLESLREFAVKYPQYSIAIPPVGAGEGRLNYSQVMLYIITSLSGLSGQIVVCDTDERIKRVARVREANQ